jgi:hypothetical protein
MPEAALQDTSGRAAQQIGTTCDHDFQRATIDHRFADAHGMDGPVKPGHDGCWMVQP